MKIEIEKKRENPASRFGNNPIYPLLSTSISTLWIKFTKDYSKALQMKSFGSNFMHGLKSAVFGNFSELELLAGLAVLQNSSQDFFSLLYFNPEKVIIPINI